jgi:hypothetical protein
MAWRSEKTGKAASKWLKNEKNQTINGALAASA